jgi:hypothetical protein
LRSDVSTCCASASSSARPFETSPFISAAFAMRSADSVPWSRAFIASVMSFEIRSSIVIRSS